jgi:GNAT superfamily N-acetyltransferase
MPKIAVTLTALRNHNHIVGDIERGVKIFESGGVQFMEMEPNNYVAHVPHKGNETKSANVSFTEDGRDIEHHFCHCCWRSRSKPKPVCRHVVALVLAIQGGIVESGTRGVTDRGLSLLFRPAERCDCALILRFIRELAEYEKMANEVVATEELLAEWLFDKRAAEVVFTVVGSKEVGFALFFPNFSTFLGRSGLYLEDLYVMPEYRNQGIGKAMLKELARIAVERGYGRFEWWCLDWNTPSIEFYRSLGAEPMSDWTVYRVSGDKLTDLAVDN